MGIASLTLGITSLVAWIDPFLGLPISGAGIIIGLLSLWRSQTHRGKAFAGVVTSLIGLVLNIVLLVFGIIAFQMFPEHFNI